ncbi:MAG: gamma-glutamylcyclotransferase family protein [Burkholderiaceae bacterium]
MRAGPGRAVSPARRAARLALLAALDAYEACADADPRPHEYVRCVLPIERQDGPALAAWVYVYQRDVDASARIVSGDYLEERTQRRPSACGRRRGPGACLRSS